MRASGKLEIMGQDNNTAIDWDALSASLDGDMELMDMLAQLFLEHIDDQLGRLQTALASRDVLAIESAAHGIKGSLAQVFAEEACNRAGELECRSHAQQIDGVEDMARELVQLVREVEDCLSLRLADGD